METVASLGSLRMKRYDVSEVEEKCFDIIDEIEETGLSALVTKDGEPNVEIRPYVEKAEQASARSLD